MFEEYVEEIEDESDPITFEEDEVSEIRDKANVNNIIKARINNYTNGLQVESVINSLITGYYVIPKFQRRFVWKKTQAANLALSLIKKVPIPPLYLYVNEKQKEVILDGQQRVTALFLYMHDLWYVGEETYKPFDFKKISELNNEVVGLEKQLEELQKESKHTGEVKKEINKCIKEKYQELREKHGIIRAKFYIDDKRDISFSSFSAEDRETIRRRRLDITVVECQSRDAKKVYADIFKLLNSGGKLLSSQEVRNGVYWELELYEKLFQVNSHKTWRKIYGKESMYSKDVEILLKILSLNYFSKIEEDNIYVDFDGTFNWSNIMGAYSDEASDWTSEKVAEQIGLLNRYLDSIKNLDDKKCNRAVFEAVFVAYCKFDICQDIDYEWLRKMDCEEEFAKGNVLSNKTSVERRLQKALKLVKEKYNV